MDDLTAKHRSTAENREVHRLAITQPDGSRRSVSLLGGYLSMGRAHNNDFSYPEDTGLSRQHIALEHDGRGWTVRDLGSKNGTLLNGEPISGKVRLKAGDRIAASRVKLDYDAEETVEEEPDLDGTVVFDATLVSAEKHPTHTVKLDDLLAGKTGASADGIAAAAGWADPVTALVRAGRELVANKPVQTLFEDLLGLSLEATGAGRGVLLTLEGEDLRVRVSRGEEFRISTAVRDRVIGERASLLIGDVMSDDVLRARQSIVVQEVHALMAVPLQTEDRVLGLLYVDTPQLFRQFTVEDLNLLTVMANVAAIRIERDRLAAAEERRRLLERDLDQAAEIQQQLLPSVAPETAGVEMMGFNRPCRTVGGDYYDFVKRTNGKILAALADVAGKGLPAALLTMNLQARVQMLAEHACGPSALAEGLNRAMIRACPMNRFVTLFLCEFDPASCEVAYTNAGHNPPFLVHADGSVEELAGGGPVLGILPDISYEQRVARFKPGDLIVIYSDGVTEAENREEEEFGEQRLQDLARENRSLPLGELIGAVRSAVEEFTAGAPATDDFTLVLVRCSRAGNSADREPTATEV